jgi:spermidine/putrescine transport system ATP-binding protein
MVQLVGITKRFDQFVAVDHVSLKIEAGEFLTLLGPSGCGKTTLLRMISGFETPTEGQVLLAGVDVTALPPYLRDVNQVFQSYAIFPHLNVRDNIAFGLKMKKIDAPELKQRVADAVAMVGLAGLEQRKPSQLSGGQRQRVALARALVCRPKVLLLDEPLAALDAKLRRAMQIELKRLQQQVGITFVFVTHDQDEAMVMSDRIAVVNHGKIEQIGSATSIYHRPATRFVADFLGQTNLLAAEIVKQNGDEVQLLLAGEIHVTIAAAIVPTGSGPLLASIRPEKIRISRDGGEGALPAIIEEELFRGPTAQITLKSPAGQLLTAMIANDSSSPSRRRGDSVFYKIDAEDVVLLRD